MSSFDTNLPLCEKHRNGDVDEIPFYFYLVLGEGYCDKHGHYAFDRDDYVISCEKCATEMGRCMQCGELLD